MFQLSGSELQLKQTSFTHPSVCMAFPGMSDPTYSAQSNITNNSYRGSAAWWQQLSAVSICSILYLFPSHPLNHRNCCLKWLLNGQCTAKVQNIKQRYPLKRFQWNITSWFVGLAVCLPVFQFSALLQCTSNCWLLCSTRLLLLLLLSFGDCWLAPTPFFLAQIRLPPLLASKPSTMDTSPSSALSSESDLSLTLPPVTLSAAAQCISGDFHIFTCLNLWRRSGTAFHLTHSRVCCMECRHGRNVQRAHSFQVQFHVDRSATNNNTKIDQGI